MDRILRAVAFVLQEYKCRFQKTDTDCFSIDLQETNSTLRIFQGRPRKAAARQYSIALGDGLKLCQLSFEASIFVQLRCSFRQVRRSAIGNQVSPSLASLTVAVLEEQWARKAQKFLQNNGSRIFIARFVDNRLIIYDTTIAQDADFQEFCQLDFYIPPVQLENEPDETCLGFRVCLQDHRIRFVHPSEEYRFRPVTSAGTPAHRLAPVQSRMSNAASYSWPFKQAEDDTETLVQIYANRGFAPSTLRSIREKCLHRRLQACEKNCFAVCILDVIGCSFLRFFTHVYDFTPRKQKTPGFFLPCLPLWQGARCVCTVCVPRLQKLTYCHSIRSFLLSLSSGVGAHCQPFGHPDEDGAGRSETPFSLFLSSSEFLFLKHSTGWCTHVDVTSEDQECKKTRQSEKDSPTNSPVSFGSKQNSAVLPEYFGTSSVCVCVFAWFSVPVALHVQPVDFMWVFFFEFLSTRWHLETKVEILNEKLRRIAFDDVRSTCCDQNHRDGEEPLLCDRAIVKKCVCIWFLWFDFCFLKVFQGGFARFL